MIGDQTCRDAPSPSLPLLSFQARTASLWNRESPGDLAVYNIRREKWGCAALHCARDGRQWGSRPVLEFYHGVVTEACACAPRRRARGVAGSRAEALFRKVKFSKSASAAARGRDRRTRRRKLPTTARRRIGGRRRRRWRARVGGDRASASTCTQCSCWPHEAEECVSDVGPAAMTDAAEGAWPGATAEGAVN